MSDGGTQKDSLSARLEERVQAQSQGSRQIRDPKMMKCDGDGKQVQKQMNPRCREKPLARSKVPVP